MKFHDATPFTADDVVFSIERALAPTSNFSPYTQGITGAAQGRRPHGRDHHDGPNPVLLPQLTEMRIMSKAWATKHNVLKPQDYQEQGGDLRLAQRQRHRPLRAEVAARPT